MKYALITDLHFGARNDNDEIKEYQLNFFENVFFPKLKEENITHIINLGDNFDRRKYVNYKTFSYFKNSFFDVIEKKYYMYCILGNHDIYYRNTNEINSPELLLKNYKNIEIVNSPKKIENMCLIPWINSNNYDEFIEFIKNIKCEYCLGHFNINGFEMVPGFSSYDGLNTKLFSKFRKVFSGHFHIRQKYGNIEYIGNPFQFTWNDYDLPKGFVIFDNETGKTKYVNYENQIFHKIFYNENEDYINMNFSKYEKSNIKVIVNEKNDDYKFDIFLKKLEESEPMSLSIVNNSHLKINEDEIESTMKNKSIISLLHEYVENENFDHKNELKEYLISLYKESENMEI